MENNKKMNNDLQFEYQKSSRYFALVAGQMESFGAEELQELGAKNPTTAYRGIYFTADKEALYKINYCSRLITRVLAPIITFDCHSTKYLYNVGKSIDWNKFFNLNQSMAIFSSVSHSKISHSKYASLRLKDAIVDQFRENTGKRPNIETRNPDIWINLHIDNNRATISIDTSGGSLHRRGYRIETGDAPMQETLAAAIIRITGWDGEKELHDPMCGSGTLLCEAAMKYCRIPAAYKRKKFGFEMLPDFEPELWKKVKSEADSKIRKLPKGLIFGSDKLIPAVKAARVNCKNIIHGENIEIRVSPFQKLENLNHKIIVTNPPYGIRMGNLESNEILYKKLGDFLKQQCSDTTAYIYCGERVLLKKIGLKTSFKIPLVNGQLDGRLVKYEMY